MKDDMGNKTNKKSAGHPTEFDSYDANIIPAETAARKEREGDDFKKTPGEIDPEASDSVHTKDGYTVDKEGLINNYPIEPEMYINEPGDLREAAAAEKSDRAAELHDIDDNDETGKLTDKKDKRGKGPGLV
jgi:hypothetical protein